MKIKNRFSRLRGAILGVALLGWTPACGGGGGDSDSFTYIDLEGTRVELLTPWCLYEVKNTGSSIEILLRPRCNLWGGASLKIPGNRVGNYEDMVSFGFRPSRYDSYSSVDGAFSATLSSIGAGFVSGSFGGLIAASFPPTSTSPIAGDFRLSF